MAIDKSRIREFPPVSITISGEDSGELLIGASRQTVAGGSEVEVRRELLGLVVAHARTGGSPVRVTTRDQESIGVLLVSPEGQIEEEYSESLDETVEPVPAGVETPRPKPQARRGEGPAAESAAPGRAADSFDSIVKGLEEGDPAPAEPAAPADPEAHVEPAPAAVRRSLRDSQSFLAVQDNIEPARKGWQGRVNNLGLSLGPGAAELAERADEHLVSRIYSGPRTIAVVNQKGGASKTPTAICLAAVFGRAGGSVLAWDNNETTGSLPWRVERGDHARSALHVLERSSHLLSDTARAADVNAFVHRQAADKYDALFSDQDIDGEHEITASEVDVLHAVASKYFNVILMDSGNNHRAANWRQMIGHTDQLVVTATTVEDRVEGARLTLQGLAGRDGRTAQLAADAVVIVSQEQPGHEKLAQLHAEKFRPYVREVHVIPFDPALKDGVIHFGALRPATQRAWLAAAASVAKGL
ncbi:MinD-like ATPase involved in chromosome partitioning or flagellar assembly [Sinomonas atrocyanea]|uniref:MinD/ParA family ATP-binding protein n=1 Tax=Sinomonas atrocyanea TaxID=37927 RepID=UPI0027874D08|nr:chromosome partitioning protein ParA [Sinomonas atrocyanea]MDP9886049.1 MinD-like ATPase involved in chromosome partitioning or flagellar assembly [Sinomonas atrocyanea]